ncbi:MAG: hypothetical protein M1831_001381 [Alyxoria varia]|nr:MAG: hypothetical protein M1831_001381 [Alyxoria varia]
MSRCAGSTGADLAICQFALEYPNIADAVAQCESNQDNSPSLNSACEALQTQLGSQLLTANSAAVETTSFLNPSATDSPASRSTGNRSRGGSAEAEPTGQARSDDGNGNGRGSRTTGSPTMGTTGSLPASAQEATQTGTAAAALQSSEAASNDHYRTHVVIPAAVVCSVVGALLIALILFFLLRRRRKQRQADQEKPALEDYSRRGGVGSPALSPMNAGATFAAAGAGATVGGAARSSNTSSNRSSFNEKRQPAAYELPGNNRFVTSAEEPSRTPDARDSVGSGSWLAAGGLHPHSRQHSEWERERQPERPTGATNDVTGNGIPTAGEPAGTRIPFKTPVEGPGASLMGGAALMPDGYGDDSSRDADDAASSYRAAMGRSSGSSRRPHENNPLDERVMGSYRSGTPQQQQGSAQVSSTPSRASSRSKNTEFMSPPRKSSKRVPARGTNPLRSAGISGFDFGFGKRKEDRGGDSTLGSR